MTPVPGHSSRMSSKPVTRRITAQSGKLATPGSMASSSSTRMHTHKKSGPLAAVGSQSRAGQKPVRGVTAHVPGKESRVARGSDHTGSIHRGVARLSLRMKFVLILAVVTVVVMSALGWSMASITTNFLFSQKLHDGIEIARSIKVIGETIANDMVRLETFEKQAKIVLPPEIKFTPEQVHREVAAAINKTCDWFGNGSIGYSDILAVNFDCAEQPILHSANFGEIDSVVEVGQPFNTITDMRTGGDIHLGKGILVYEGNKASKNGGTIPIYRFKIELDSSFSRGGIPANVRVDIAARSVERVSQNLWTTIGIAVLIAIAVVVVIAHVLAANVTQPLVMLMRDMKVVARGNLDHETKPRSHDEIGVLAMEFNRMTQNLKTAQVALVEQEKAEYELSIAREVQRQLLPTETPSIAGFESAAFYQGAKAVSGDYFDFIPLGDGLWGFIIADVSGKGIPGSMVMAVTRTIVRLVANKHRGHAAETLKETNRLISKQIKRGMFVTACYAILDEGTGILTYASAGHNPMAIYRAATKTCELAQGKGIALGFNEGPLFDKTIQEQTTQLNRGDIFFLYTDGFPEAMDAKNQEFGEDNFFKTISDTGHMDVRACTSELVAAIAAHRGDHEQSDDLTMIAVKSLL